MTSIRINVGNSYSQIQGLTVQEHSTLAKELSYVVGGSSAYFSGYGIRRKSLLSKRGEFPTGLIHRVFAMFPKAESWHASPPKAQIPKKLNVIPYLWQKQALDAAMKTNRGTISATTGSGKALLIAMIAARLNVKTLVVVPSLELVRQLTDSINALGLKNVDVWNIDSAALKFKNGYECLILDEIHHAAAKTYQKLNKTVWNDIYYRYGTTATAFRNDTEETLLYEAIAGEVIYTLSYKDAVAGGYVVPLEAYYIDLPKKEAEAYTWAEVYKELVVDNKDRNDVLHKLLESLYNSGKSTLCLVKEVRHGNNIGWHAFVNGEDDESRRLIGRFNSREIKCLVGTEGILAEGVDTKPCEYVIVAGLGKAKSRFMQAIGRCLRNYSGKVSGKVILIRDKSHKFCLTHFRQQVRILKEEYGISPQRIGI